MAVALSGEHKFEELILYISQKCANDTKFGATKLNKILFFSDFLYYATNSRSITGQEYQRLPNGPAPRRLVPVRKRMVNERSLALFRVPLADGKHQDRTAALRSPNLGKFKADEIAMVDTVITALADKNADQVSNLSHKFVSWIAARNGETIPYQTIFVSNPRLTTAEVHRGRQIGRDCGLSEA